MSHAAKTSTIRDESLRYLGAIPSGRRPEEQTG